MQNKFTNFAIFIPTEMQMYLHSESDAIGYSFTQQKGILNMGNLAWHFFPFRLPCGNVSNKIKLKTKKSWKHFSEALLF